MSVNAELQLQSYWDKRYRKYLSFTLTLEPFSTAADHLSLPLSPSPLTPTEEEKPDEDFDWFRKYEDIRSVSFTLAGHPSSRAFKTSITS